MTKTLSPFAKQVYALTDRIPAGKVATYKMIGQAMRTKAYRVIGQILSINPDAPDTPCHRVVASNGHLHGFNGSRSKKELTKKAKLLTQEGVKISHHHVVDLPSVLFTFAKQPL